MRRKATVALMVSTALAWALNAQPTEASPKHRPWKAYDAIVLCNSETMTEDTALPKHLKLVQFEHAPEGWVIVYKCKHNW